MPCTGPSNAAFIACVPLGSALALLHFVWRERHLAGFPVLARLAVLPGDVGTLTTVSMTYTAPITSRGSVADWPVWEYVPRGRTDACSDR